MVSPNERRGKLVVVVPFICYSATNKNDGLGSRRKMTAGKPSLLEALSPLHSFATAFFHGQFRLLPRFPAAGHIPKLVKSLGLQNTRGDACAVAAPAVNRRRFVAIKFLNPVTQVRDINVMRSRNMTPFPFTGRTHIDDLQRRLSFVQLVHAHLADSFQRKARCMPRSHSANQIAGESRVSGPNK